MLVNPSVGSSFGTRAALVAREEAEKVARTPCKISGHAAMIALYSRSLIANRVGLHEAAELNRRARGLWEVVGHRQFYFTGLGSIWPDVLGWFKERAGREGKIPHA